MGYGNKSLNDWRDDAERIGREHGFTEATVLEDMALIHSEVSEAVEDFRNGRKVNDVWYTKKVDGVELLSTATEMRKGVVVVNKPCGIPSEMADVIIRVLHFCGRHNIDIEQAVREKMVYNEERPMRHGGKKL